MTMRKISKVKGVTLIELMIAMALNLILVAGAFSVYIGNQRLYRIGEGLARIQENFRIANDHINREVRMAGSGFSCLQDIENLENMLKTPNNFDYNFKEVVKGYDNTKNLPNELSGKVVDNTDVLVIRGSYGTGVKLETEMPNSSAVLKTTVINPAPFSSGDIVVITDCRSASIFQVTNYTSSNGNIVHNSGNNNPGNISSKFSRTFQAGASVIKTRTVSYYIGENSSGDRALFRRIVDKGVTQDIEIVDGVLDMQIEYAEDQDGNGFPDGYFKANQVVDWNKVISVRVNLLASSEEDNLADEIVDYRFDGVTNTPQDRKIYRTTSFVVAIRGRLG